MGYMLLMTDNRNYQVSPPSEIRQDLWACRGTKAEQGYRGAAPISFYGPAWVFFVWISWIFWVLVLILWFILMVKAYQMQKFKLPIVGDIAEKHS